MNEKLSVLQIKYQAMKDGTYNLGDLSQIKLQYKSNRKSGELGEKQFWLYKNENAPWDGLLLNPEAMAVIISEYESLLARADLALQTQRNEDLAKLNLETGKLNLIIDAQTQKSVIELQGRDAEIKSCQKINSSIVKDKTSIGKKILLGIGAAAAGILTGILLDHFVL